MLLIDQIANNLKTAPETEIIEFRGEWTTRAGVQRIADFLAEISRANALGAGAAIGLLARNQPGLLASIAGIVLCEQCVVTISPFRNEARIVDEVKQLRTPVVIAAEQDWAMPGLREAVAGYGGIGVSIPTAANAVPRFVGGCEKLGAGPFHAPLPGILVHMTTSGTTGPAKRVPLRYDTVETNALGWAKVEVTRGIEHQLDPKTLTIILHNPIVHISGMVFTLQSFFTSHPLCLLEKFNVAEWQVAMRKYRPKYTGLPPTAIRMVMEANVPKEDLASLMAVRAGTAPLDEKTRERFEEMYGIPLLTNYGATEFGSAVTQWRLEDYQAFGDKKRGSVGNPVHDISLRVIDVADPNRILPTGEVGVLEVRATRFGPDAEWIRTTDLASLDEDGFLYIHGRSDQAIIRGGFKVLPQHVGETLVQHPKVRDAVVIGIPDERLGAVPVAAVEPADPANPPEEGELIAFLREHLVSYQVPVKIKVMPQLPRTPSMKSDLGALRGLFTAA